MKKLYKRSILTLIFGFFFAVSVQAQELEEVVNYVRGNNVSGMVKYFDEMVAITINNNQASYSSAQAEIVLKDFFVKNPVKEFTIVQSGTSGSNSKYAIGDLTTANGSFQLYVVMKQKDEKYVLREIRFEKK